MRGKCFIGTSGWMYDHWKGVFYPSDLKKGDWLAFYMRFFNSVEINNTFYRLPSPNVFEAWENQATEKFIYALKGSRFITHMKKLKEPERSLNLFLERAKLLDKKLGPVLFQLPPGWTYNPDRFREFVGTLPHDVRFAFEFRDLSWFNDDVYDILREKNVSLCIYHMPDYLSPIEITANFAYIRFHGTDFLYGGRYSRNQLSKWADLIQLYMKGGLDVYVYFNNDAEGYAVINAEELRTMLKAGKD